MSIIENGVESENPTRDANEDSVGEQRGLGKETSVQNWPAVGKSNDTHRCQATVNASNPKTSLQ